MSIIRKKDIGNLMYGASIIIVFIGSGIIVKNIYIGLPIIIVSAILLVVSLIISYSKK